MFEVTGCGPTMEQSCSCFFTMRAHIFPISSYHFCDPHLDKIQYELIFFQCEVIIFVIHIWTKHERTCFGYISKAMFD